MKSFSPVTSVAIGVVLLAGIMSGALNAAGPSSGPLVKSDGFDSFSATITFVLGGTDVHPGSISFDAVAVSSIDLADSNSSWNAESIDSLSYNPGTRTISVELSGSPPPGVLLRAMLIGTGQQPVVGVNGAPLGAKGQDIAGVDYVTEFVVP